MKKYALLILLFSVFSQYSFCQNDMSKKYHLMPWPKSIEEHNSKLILNSDIAISIIGENQGRVHNAAVNFLRRLSGRTGIFINGDFR